MMGSNDDVAVAEPVSARQDTSHTVVPVFLIMGC